MSATIVHVTPQRVLVAADTLASTLGDDGIQFQVTKIHSLPHLSAVIAGRGVLQINQKLVEAFSTFPTLDAVVAMLPTMLAEQLAALREQRDAAGGEPYLHGQDIVIAGWSQLDRRMRAWHCHTPTADAPVECEEINESLVLPWDSQMNDDVTPAIPAPATREAIVEVCESMATFYARFRAPSPVGGLLVVAEITRDSTTLSTREFPTERKPTPQRAVIRAENTSLEPSLVIADLSNKELSMSDDEPQYSSLRDLTITLLEQNERLALGMAAEAAAAARKDGVHVPEMVERGMAWNTLLMLNAQTRRSHANIDRDLDATSDAPPTPATTIH